MLVMTTMVPKGYWCHIFVWFLWHNGVK